MQTEYTMRSRRKVKAPYATQNLCVCIQVSQLIISKFTMPFIKKILLLVVSTICLASYAQKPIYGFAYTTSLKDSVVYLSALQTIPEAQVGKYDFLNFRADYGKQFSTYIQQSYGLPYVTTVVYFDKSRSKLEKRYLRVRRVAKYEQRKQIVEVNYSDFKFGPIK